VAEAPKPGVGKRKEAAKAAAQILILKYDGEKYPLALWNLPMNERRAIRKESGLPFEEWFIGTDAGGNVIDVTGEDSFGIFYWLARRANGEPGLHLADVDAVWDVKKFQGIDVEGDVEPTGDDPEALGQPS
jgi:hypothetical protein